MTLPSPLRDHLFVQVDTASLDRTPSGVYIPDWQRGDKDATKAEVVAVPVGLSRERPLDYPGMDGRAYTFADLVGLPVVGETVYLMPNTFKPDLEYPGHPGVFLVSLDKVVAVAGPEGLRPFQGLLLCEEVYGDDVRQRADGVRERVKASPDWQSREHGDITIHWKQSILLGEGMAIELNPLPIPFTLRILHAGQPLCGQENVVAEGDTIVAHRMLFAYHAVKQSDEDDGSGRWMWQPPKINIEGREYAYCPRQCVMGKQQKAFQWPAPMKSHRAVTDLFHRSGVDEEKYHLLTNPTPGYAVAADKVGQMRPIMGSMDYVREYIYLPLHHPATMPNDPTEE